MSKSLSRSKSEDLKRWRLIARVFGLVTSFIGALVLVGWALNVTALKSISSGMVSMKANTAAGMLLCGVALALLSLSRDNRWIGYVATAAALVVIALGTLTLSQYLIGWELRIDQFLFSDLPGTAATLHPGRMSLASAFCFVLAGGALLATAQRTYLRLRQPIVSGLGVSLTTIAVLALLGYLLEARFGYHLWNYTGTAVHSAIGFVLLGSGLLALVRSEGGLKWSLDILNTTAFVIAVMVLVIASGTSYNFAKQLVETASWVSHTQEVLQEVQETISDVANIDNAQRTFIITADEQFLIRLAAAKNQMAINLASVRKLTADNSAQQNRLERIEPLIAERIEFADRTVAVRKQQGFAAAQQMVASGTGTNLSDRIGSLLKEMQNEEQILLHKRQAQLDKASLTTFLLLPLGLFLTLTTLSLGVFFLNAGVAERLEAERAAADSQARMAGDDA